MGAENIDRVPWLFRPIEPFINKMSYYVEYIHMANGSNWILTIAATSLTIRFFLLPIFYFHSKRIAKVANKSGLLKLFSHIYKTTSLTKFDKIKNLIKVTFRSSRTLKLKPFNIIGYYLFLFPFITSTIFGLRKVMGFV
jgi:membrane protein insertase Oxa1/YidC/SpoIIIJ